MKKVKFAILGCGHIGKRHAEMVSRNMHAELVALIDSKEAGELQVENYPVPFFQSLPDFFAAGIDTDVITIATPNGLHATHALQCLDAKKHIVIEKPIALTKKDAEQILSRAYQSGCRFDRRAR